ncbi:MAG: hypothetical protein Salg2KO_15310 [Salibacteraceae bacterium]
MKYITVIIGSLLWIAFYALIIHETIGQPLSESFMESLVLNASVIIAVIIASRAMVFVQRSIQQPLWVAISSIALSVGVVFVDQLIGVYFMNSWFDVELFKANSILMHVGFGFVISASAVGLRVQQLSMMEQKAIEKRKEDTERLAKEAELLKLRHQLQPHFLFNSLNSVNALIGSQPEFARKMVQQISEFLRGTLRSDDSKLVSLNQEMEHIQLYLEIEKVRFGHRLKTVVQVDDHDLEMKIPPLLLQPIMENAIKFGLYGTTDEVTIKLGVESRDGMLLIKVSNPIDQEYKTQKGTGFGLSSIARRLHLIFGRNDLLTSSKDQNTFTTTVKIPQL